jgi:uncharacterized nucleotidyltransferase DUF6036
MAMSPMDGLLVDIDRQWKPLSETRFQLRIIGASALLLQTDYQRATKDSDVLEGADNLGVGAKAQLLALGGEDTSLARKHRLYIDSVAPGLPFLPQGPRWHPLDALTSRLTHFEVWVLDIVDVVVSKLFRFHANDRSDVDAMIERALVDHDVLVSRFRSAVDMFSHDSRCNRLPRCVENLHTIERDSFGVSETKIELPPWFDD